MFSRDNVHSGESSFRLPPRFERTITVLLILLLLSISAFRGVEFVKGWEFERRAEGVYRDFLSWSYESEVEGGNLLVINISRAAEFRPPGELSVEITLKLYGGESTTLLDHRGSGGGVFTYEKQRTLLVYRQGEYIPAVLTFRAEGGW